MNILEQLLPPRVIECLRYLRHGRLTWGRKLPSSSTIVYGMTTGEEQSLFKKSVEKVAQLDGAIIDLGCWLGSTTISMAKGLREAGSDGKIYAFDLFKWDAWMDDYSDDHWCEYQHGESFLPETRRRVSEYKKHVNLIEADLTTYAWKHGKIRLLLIDAMKSWELATDIAREFFPFLVKDARVLQQDYLAFSVPYMPILHYRLRGYMHYDAHVDVGATVGFRVVNEIPLEEAIKAGDFSQLTDEEAEAAFDWSHRTIGDGARIGTALVRVMYYIGKNDLKRATELLSGYDAEKFDKKDQFKVVRKALDLALARQRLP
jgi:hypothetical protein